MRFREGDLVAYCGTSPHLSPMRPDNIGYLLGETVKMREYDAGLYLGIDKGFSQATVYMHGKLLQIPIYDLFKPWPDEPGD